LRQRWDGHGSGNREQSVRNAATGGIRDAVAILNRSMAIAALNNASANLARNTMPLSAIIVDDEQLARDELAYLLKNLGDVNVVAQGKNGLEGVNLIKEHNPDLVFLDVQMPGLDGFGVIKKLLDRKVPLPKIVFATAFDQYAVKAFEVNAVDYLLKPFDKKRVALSVEKARAKIEAGAGPEEKFDTLLRMLESQKPQTAKILIKAAGRLFLTDPKDICYATIEDGVITVATSGHAGLEGQSNCRTLEELFDSLDPASFWRAHRSFLVNINHIREVVPWFKSSYQLRMDDKKQTEVPVSRAQTRRLRELFNL
jgi:two-component system response regulator LytT